MSLPDSDSKEMRMKIRSLSALVLALAVPALAEEKMPWAKDWESAKQAAAGSKKLVMVDFYTTW